jgi:hypothetical protein
MKKVFILGAGASYGHGAATDERPPKATDFFTNQFFETIKNNYKPLIGYLQSVISKDLSSKEADIEFIYSEIESMWKMGHINWDFIEENFGLDLFISNPVEMLHSLIIDTLFLSSTWLKDFTCEYHDFLVSEFINPGDTIINFNYDLIMDVSLLKYTDWKDNRYGYRLDEYESSDDKKIKYLKLHGSLNWFKRKDLKYVDPFREGNRKPEWEESVQIINVNESLNGQTHMTDIFGSILEISNKYIKRQKEVSIRKAVSHFMKPKSEEERKEAEKTWIRITLLNEKKGFDATDRYNLFPIMIVPTPYKPFEELRRIPFDKLWGKAHQAILDANEIWACGFSFRDPHFNQLLKETSLVKNEPLILIVCNKNEDERVRIRTLRSKQRVVKFFNGYLGDLINEMKELKKDAKSLSVENFDLQD